MQNSNSFDWPDIEMPRNVFRGVCVWLEWTRYLSLKLAAISFNSLFSISSIHIEIVKTYKIKYKLHARRIQNRI